MKKLTIILSLLIMSLVTHAQRHIITYDPELLEPVRDVLVWTDHNQADSTNLFGEIQIPEKFDTLHLNKPGYISLAIAREWVEDSIPMIQDLNNIGEVVVYGTDPANRVQTEVTKWAKEARTEYQLRHPITGINFDATDLFNARQRKFKRQRRRLEKIFKKMDVNKSDAIIQSYRRVLNDDRL